MHSQLNYTKEELETKFANNFAIPNFHLLAEIKMCIKNRIIREMTFDRERTEINMNHEGSIDTAKKFVTGIAESRKKRWKFYARGIAVI